MISLNYVAKDFKHVPINPPAYNRAPKNNPLPWQQMPGGSNFGITAGVAESALLDNKNTKIHTIYFKKTIHIVHVGTWT